MNDDKRPDDIAQAISLQLLNQKPLSTQNWDLLKILSQQTRHPHSHPEGSRRQPKYNTNEVLDSLVVHW
jgi:LPS sulfotransferase NodH